MKISGFPVVIPLSQRGDILERIQKDVPRENARNNDVDSDDRSFEKLNSHDENIQQQRIDAQDQVRRVNANRQQATEQFPLSTQRALEAFNSNGPVAEQQLGIELVGVDIFA